MQFFKRVEADKVNTLQLEKTMTISVSVDTALKLRSISLYRQGDVNYMALDLYMMDRIKEPKYDFRRDDNYLSDSDIIYNNSTTIIQHIMTNILKLPDVDISTITPSVLYREDGKVKEEWSDDKYFVISSKAVYDAIKEKTKTVLTGYYSYATIYDIETDSFLTNRSTIKHYMVDGVESGTTPRANKIYASKTGDHGFGEYHYDYSLPINTSSKQLAKKIKEAIQKIKVYIEETVLYYQAIQEKQKKDYPIEINVTGK